MYGEVDTSSDGRVREIRRCGKCTAPQLTVVHVTQHYNRGLPVGRTYVHRCGACNTSFDSISLWRAIVFYLSAGFVASIGFSMVALFLGTLFEQGLALFQYADGRMWGTWAFGAAAFLGGAGWCAWTTWLLGRLILLNPVAGTR
jgi:hypothetical protein